MSNKIRTKILIDIETDLENETDTNILIPLVKEDLSNLGYVVHGVSNLLERVVRQGVPSADEICGGYTKERVLRIVDACFHCYASSYRNDARQYAEKLMDK